MHSAADVQGILDAQAPLVARCLSDLGRAAFFPPDIPFQAQEARETRFNGTIGVLTDGAGRALPFDSMRRALAFDADDLDRAFLYSPVLGVPELRQAWRRWQRGAQAVEPIANDVPSTLPVATCGLTHGLSLVADLFGDVGRWLILGTPFWGNYRQIFGMRRGIDVRTAPFYSSGIGGRGQRFDPEALAPVLAAAPAGEPALVVANFPSNPGGYAPTREERERFVAALCDAADHRPLVVVCDDAYSGLTFSADAVATSLFWQLAGRHPNLLPIKIDGATKEFAFFGGRVGFLTFGLDLGAEASAALENKISSLIRATVGSPSASSQIILLKSLREDPAAEVGRLRQLAVERYRAVRPALDALDPNLLRPLPFNAGFFVLMQLVPDLDPDHVRRYLIETHDVGVVSSQPDFLRLALCSLSAEQLPEAMARIERGVRELAAG
ncbi:MAG: aminotransferase class I/II-fold pyridoxal phosphate-dependent enzyme [Acidobacteriota bacterium]